MLLCILDSSKLYQWDTGRNLIIKKEGVDKVYFFHTGDEEAYSLNLDENKKVKIPEALLASSEDIQVHLISAEGATIGLGLLKVTPRPRPSNYIERTEENINIVKLLEERIKLLYVTPEMYGTGEPFKITLRTEEELELKKDNGPRFFEGVDWSKEIQAAIDSTFPVHFGSKEYCCRDVFTKNVRNVHLKGTGKTVIKWKLAETKVGRYSSGETIDREFMGMISDDNYEMTGYNKNYIKGGDILLENIIFDGNGDVIPTWKINKGNTKKPDSIEDWQKWKRGELPHYTSDGYFSTFNSKIKYILYKGEYYEISDRGNTYKKLGSEKPASNLLETGNHDFDSANIYQKAPENEGHFRKWTYNGGNPFGLCLFHCRDNVTVKNCTFQNCIADGIHANGLRHKLTVEGCVFKDLGLYQPFDGTRNGISTGRTCWDRGKRGYDEEGNELYGYTYTSKGDIFVEVRNCSFENIADECMRADGVSHLIIDNCTMNNIGHYILETGHRTDRTRFTHTISNCIGNNINGIYATGADGGVYNIEYTRDDGLKVTGYPYEGDIEVKNCNFTNLFKRNPTPKFRRSSASSLITAYDGSTKPIELPRVFIENSTIIARDNEEEEGIPAWLNGHMLGGSCLYMKNSNLLLNTVHARGIIACSKELVVENSNLKFKKLRVLGNNENKPEGYAAADYCISPCPKIIFKDSSIRCLEWIFHFISTNLSDSYILFDNCKIDLDTSLGHLILFSNEVQNTSLIFKNNLCSGKINERCIHFNGEQKEQQDLVIIINNYFPQNYIGAYGSICNAKGNVKFKVFKGNRNFTE